MGGKERWIGNLLVDLFRNSSLGLFQCLLSAVQSSRKTPARISSYTPVHLAITTHRSAKQFDPKEMTRDCQSIWVWEASRTHQSITRSSLQSQPQRPAVWCKENQCWSLLLLSVGSYYILSKHHHPLTCLLQQIIIWHNWVSKGTRNFRFS